LEKLKVKKQLKPLLLGLALVAGLIVITVFNVGSAKPKATPSSNANLPCGLYRNDGNVVIDGQRINVEIPRNPTEFERGLGGRACILPNQGMFFSFKNPGQYPFWMKGMRFPIDIVWIAGDHKVVAIEVDEQPSTYPDKFVNRIPAQHVLEIKANRTKELHMTIGTTVAF
jgi:uncharacterized membrane protein (UPF0127 family)